MNVECEFCDNLIKYGLLEAQMITLPSYKRENGTWVTTPTKTKRLVHQEMVPVSFYFGIRCRKDGQG